MILPITLEDEVWAGRARVIPTTTTDSGAHEYVPYLHYACVGSNQFTNPAFINHDSGLATGVTVTGTGTSGTIAPSIVAGAPRRGNWQRIQYTGVAGDSGATIAIQIESAAGSFGASTPMCANWYIKGACSGVTVNPCIDSVTSLNVVVNSVTGTAIVPTVAHQWGGAYRATAGTGANHVHSYVLVSGIDEGDVVDLYVGNPNIDKFAFPVMYLDGEDPYPTWAGTADASTSSRAAGTNVRFGETTVAGQWIDNEKGTVIWGQTLPYGSGVGTGGAGFLTRNAAATRYPINLNRTANADTFTFKITDDSNVSASVISPAVTWSAFETIPIIARWTAGGADSTIDLCVKESEATQVTHALTLGEMIWWGSVCTTDPIIGPCYILRRRIPDDEFAAFKVLITAIFRDPLSMWRNVMQPGDSCWPLTGSTLGYMKVSES